MRKITQVRAQATVRASSSQPKRPPTSEPKDPKRDGIRWATAKTFTDKSANKARCSSRTCRASSASCGSKHDVDCRTFRQHPSADTRRELPKIVRKRTDLESNFQGLHVLQHDAVPLVCAYVCVEHVRVGAAVRVACLLECGHASTCMRALARAGGACLCAFILSGKINNPTPNRIRDTKFWGPCLILMVAVGIASASKKRGT